MARKSGLGRGLDSLISIGVMEETAEVEKEVADRKAARAKAANRNDKGQTHSDNGNEKKGVDVLISNVDTESKKKQKQSSKKTTTSHSVKSQVQTTEKIKENAVEAETEAVDVSVKEEVIPSTSKVEAPKSEEISKSEEILKSEDASFKATEAALKVGANLTIEVETSAAEEPKTGFVTLKLTEIEPNREQPRKEFNEDALQELAESIKIHGVIQPLLVQKKGEYYEIIAGERRWRAAKIAGIKEVPAVICEYTPRETMEISLIENIQREDLNAIEEARAYQKLIQEFHLKQEEIAVKVSKSRTAIANTMRLLKLDERVQTMLIEDEISSGHARALLPLEDGDLQYQAAQKIASESLSVRETEKLVKLLLAPPKEETPKEETRDDGFIYQALEEKMKTIMGTKVTIHKKDNNKGRIEIEYYSPDDLERITDLIATIRQG